MSYPCSHVVSASSSIVNNNGIVSTDMQEYKSSLQNMHIYTTKDFFHTIVTWHAFESIIIYSLHSTQLLRVARILISRKTQRLFACIQLGSITSSSSFIDDCVVEYTTCTIVGKTATCVSVLSILLHANDAVNDFAEIDILF